METQLKTSRTPASTGATLMTLANTKFDAHGKERKEPLEVSLPRRILLRDD